jgi:hypothetical protein
MDWPGFEPGPPWWVKYKATKLWHYEYVTKLTIQDMFSAFFWWVTHKASQSVLSQSFWLLWCFSPYGGHGLPSFLPPILYFLRVSKQFRFYEVGLSVLHPTPNNPGMRDHTSSCATTSIAWWIVETHEPHYHSSRSCTPRWKFSNHSGLILRIWNKILNAVCSQLNCVENSSNGKCLHKFHQKLQVFMYLAK